MLSGSSSPFELVLWDLDGTLIDSTDLILSSYRHTMQVHRGEEFPAERWLTTLGRPLLTQLREFAADEAEVAEMALTYRAHNRAVHDELVRPFGGIRQALEACRACGVPLGIVTSKHWQGTHMGLRSCKLPASWFEVIITSDTCAEHKPHPGPVVAAVRAVGVSASPRVLFVGDSVYDMQAGRSAGVATCAALWGPSGVSDLEPAHPTYWLDTAEDLVTLVRGGVTPLQARPPGPRPSPRPASSPE